MAIIIRWNCFKFSAYRWVHMSCVEEMLKSKSFLAQGYPTSKCSWCDTKINETEVIRFADVAYIHKDCVKHVVDAVYKIREQYGPILMAREI